MECIVIHYHCCRFAYCIDGVTCHAVCCIRFEDTWARVISGTDEGMYGWLALNYEQGLLQHQFAAAHSQPAATAAPVTLGILGASTSLGALDLGGSSLEMTHEVLPGSSSSSSGGSSTGQVAPLPRGTQNVTVAGHTYHLHTHTFRHYGLNEAFDRSVTLLLDQQQQQQLQNATTAMEALSASQPAAAAVNDSIHAVSAPVQMSLPADETMAHQAQVDLAVAAAAGLKPRMPSIEAPAAASMSDSNASTVPSSSSSGSSSSSTSSSSEEAAAAAHQADLAVAAAAGVHPKTADAAPSAGAPVTDASGFATAQLSLPHSSSSGSSTSNSSSTADELQQQHIQADLAVAAAAGLLPTQTGPLRNDSAVISSSGGSSSTAASASGSQQEGMPADLQAPSSTDSSSHPAASSSILHSGTPTKAPEHRALQSRDRRRQQRRMRQLLLQQHKYLGLDEFLHWDTGLNSALASTQSLQTSSAGIMNSSSSSEPAVLPLGSSMRLGLAQGLLRRLLAHSSASAAAPGASRQEQAESSSTPSSSSSSSSSSSAERSSSIARIGSLAPVPTAFAPVAGSSGAVTPAADSSHPPQQTVDHGHGSNRAPDEPGAAATVHGAEVWHPCLHDGFSGSYERLAYDGTAPNPIKVRNVPQFLQ
jgi:hypothetical protein